MAIKCDRFNCLIISPVLQFQPLSHDDEEDRRSRISKRSRSPEKPESEPEKKKKRRVEEPDEGNSYVLHDHIRNF